MDKIENFLKEPSMEKLERLRGSEIKKIGEKLELNIQNSMRKHELVRKITEHMVDENVFEEAALEELSNWRKFEYKTEWNWREIRRSWRKLELNKKWGCEQSTWREEDAKKAMTVCK